MTRFGGEDGNPGYIIVYNEKDDLAYSVFMTDSSEEDEIVFTNTPLMEASSLEELMALFAQLNLAFIEGPKNYTDVFGEEPED